MRYSLMLLFLRLAYASLHRSFSSLFFQGILSLHFSYWS